MRLLFIFLPICVFSQQLKKADSVFCDCQVARTVVLKGNTRIGPTMAPVGGGQKAEISERKQKTKYAFDREHNSAWYKLEMNTDGFLVFDIIPHMVGDDYDFMLFRAGKKRFCDSLVKHHIKPIRAGIARNKEEIKGLTGLSFSGKKDLIKEGLNDAYARPMDVKKGEVYYLVLDNVYENGGGHTINFYFDELVSLKGSTKNENDQPIAAEIVVNGPRGDTIKKTNSDPAGNYHFDVVLRRDVNYSLDFYSDSTFFASKEISTKTNIDTLKNLVTVLPTLRKGNKYTIYNINFQPGQITLLPSAWPSVKNLARLMRKNDGLRILIVGHMNGCDGDQGNGIRFTKERALTVRNYLVSRSIHSDRIAVDGKGCKEMLYPLHRETPEWQQVANRRVEVFITDK